MTSCSWSSTGLGSGGECGLLYRNVASNTNAAPITKKLHTHAVGLHTHTRRGHSPGRVEIREEEIRDHRRENDGQRSSKPFQNVVRILHYHGHYETPHSLYIGGV